VRRGVGSDDDDRDEYKLSYHRATDKAWFLSDTGREDDASWYPKSQVDCDVGDPQRGRVYTFRVPQWLAEKNGIA
jgi:hypothetical protein